MLKGVKKGNAPITWLKQAEDAFHESKRDLADTTMLVHPIPSASVSLAVDASDYAIEAVLQQRVCNLATAGIRYEIPDSRVVEVLRILRSTCDVHRVKRFRHAAERRNFVIFIDHESLAYTFNQNLDKCSPRQFRHLDYIGQFTTDTRYIKGLDNNVADALSRIEAIEKSVDHRTLAATQKNDTELHEIVNSGTCALQLKKVRFPDHDVEIFCDITSEVVRPYVPKPLRQRIQFATRTFPSRETDDAFRLAVDEQGFLKLDTAMNPVSAM